MPQTPNVKKFLDADGLTYFTSLLNNYPTNSVLQAVIDAIDQVKADKTDIVNSDWNATSGVAQILNKPTIPAATTVTQVLTSGTVIATINGTNIYAPSYTDADGVSY